MCTIGYHRDLGIIFKNRDKTSVIAEEIVQDKHFIACRSHGADYFSWGINAHGCAFVTAAINTPRWIQLVYDGNSATADQIYKEETAGLENPVAIVSSMLPDVKEIASWIDAATSRSFLSMGYNLLFADRCQAVVVESYRDKRHLSVLEPRKAITNHFQTLNHGPQEPGDYLSSFRRNEYANGLLSNAKSLMDIFDLLKPSDQQQRQLIWRNGPFFTISSSVLDFNHCMAYFAEDKDRKYKKFSLNDT